MYITIAKIIKNNKRVGFLCQDNTGNKHKLYDNQIIALMNAGEIFDITYSNRGFYFKDHTKTIKNLKSIQDTKVNIFKKQSTSMIIDEYTSDNLRNYIKNSGTLQLKQRDFVKAITEYCNGREVRVLSISGLRGTGKTTGILQAINEINQYDNTVLINIDPTAEMTCLDLRNLILTKYSNAKYIFIDEITRIKDIINNSAFLADNLCMSGKKVIISGTDSLALTHMKRAALYHRVININITFIKYAEAERTANQSLREYIEMGGLYKADSIKDIEGLRDYIDTAVIDNIMNTITKNVGVTHLFGIQKLGINKIRTIVFRILYAVVYLNIQRIRDTSTRRIVNLYDYSSSALYNESNLNSLACAQMNVDEKISTNINEVGNVLSALKDIGIIDSVQNIYNNSEYNYYITNPSITNQIIRAIVSTLDTTGLNKTPNATIKGLNGLVFESVIIKHTIEAAKKLGLQVYFYHDTSNAEIDLIVEKKYSPGLDDEYLYYEIKMTSDQDRAVASARWINDKTIESNIGGVVKQRAIVYGGISGKFTEFKDKSTYVKGNMTLQQLESQNKEVKLINAQYYMKNTIKELKTL